MKDFDREGIHVSSEGNTERFSAGRSSALDIDDNTSKRDTSDLFLFDAELEKIFDDFGRSSAFLEEKFGVLVKVSSESNEIRKIVKIAALLHNEMN